MCDQCKLENYFEYCLSYCEHSILYSEKLLQTKQACAHHPESCLTCICASQVRLTKNILFMLCITNYVKWKLNAPMASQVKLTKNILIMLCITNYVKWKLNAPMNGLQPFSQ